MREEKPEFRAFNSAFSVYARVLSQTSILSKQSVDQLPFPYPMKKFQNNQPIRYPNSLLNFKNIYLIHIKFDKSLIRDEYRANFFQFIHQLWSQPKVVIEVALRYVSCEESIILDLENKFGKTRLKSQVCDLHALEIYEIFNYLTEVSFFDKSNNLDDFYERDTINEFIRK